MHSCVGLDTEYLGEEFLQTVQKCVERAKGKGMLACYTTKTAGLLVLLVVWSQKTKTSSAHDMYSSPL